MPQKQYKPDIPLYQLGTDTITEEVQSGSEQRDGSGQDICTSVVKSLNLQIEILMI